MDSIKRNGSIEVTSAEAVTILSTGRVEFFVDGDTFDKLLNQARKRDRVEEFERNYTLSDGEKDYYFWRLDIDHPEAKVRVYTHDPMQPSGRDHPLATV